MPAPSTGRGSARHEAITATIGAPGLGFSGVLVVTFVVLAAGSRALRSGS